MTIHIFSFACFLVAIITNWIHLAYLGNPTCVLLFPFELIDGPTLFWSVSGHVCVETHGVH